MTTLSVPLTVDLLSELERLVREGKIPNKAAGMRDALRLYLEEQAVQTVLRAHREPTLYGDLHELAQSI